MRRLSFCLVGVAMLVFVGMRAGQAPSTSSDSPEDLEVAGGKPTRAALENRMENLTKQFELTDSQKQKIRPVLKHEFEKIKEARDNPNLTQGQVRRRTMQIRRNTRERIDEILTPEQKTKWQEARQEQHVQGGQGKAATPGGPDNPPAPPNPANQN
jgi:Spy/CpxP family protein refolding chaperone